MAKPKRNRITQADLRGITIVQSNNVTKARYNYSVYQGRVLALLMYMMQPYIEKVKQGSAKGGVDHVEKLQLFADRRPSDVYGLEIEMHIIGKPSQYKEIREEIARMASSMIQIPTQNKGMLKMAGLFSSVEIPIEEGKRHSSVRVEIRKDVMQALMDIIRRENKAEQYTIYMLYVSMAAKFKYTSKLYMLLCSYRERGVWRVKVDELRDLLQIPDRMYANFSDLKRFVLDRIAGELQAIGDLYYDTSDTNFIERGDNNKIVWLRFRIQYPATERTFELNREKFITQMHNIFGCNDTHIARILPYLNMKTNWNNIDDAMDRAYFKCQREGIRYPAAYVVKCVLEVVENAVVPI